MPRSGAQVSVSHKWKVTIMGLQFDVIGVENAPSAGPVAHHAQLSRCRGAHRATAEQPRMPVRSEQICHSRGGKRYASIPVTISSSRFLYGPCRVTCDGTRRIKCPHTFPPGGGRD